MRNAYSIWVRLRAPLGGSSIAYTALIVLGVFVLELLFIASYAGGLHKPQPRQVPVAVVGPAQAIERLQAAVSPLLKLRPARSATAARAAIDDRKAYGALVFGRGGDTLIASQAPSSFTHEVVVQTLATVERKQGRPLRIVDVHRLPSSDPRGYTSFYVALSWVVGGYLAAIVIALARGSAARTRTLALARVGALALYALASGVLGAVLTVPLMGLLHDHLWKLIAIGALLVFATAAATLALQAMLGILGTGLAIAAFVILANPASGGPFPRELLRDPWRSTGAYLPTGAGTDAMRNTLYFGGHATLRPLLILAIYAAVGDPRVIAFGGVGVDQAEATPKRA
jgi:hypothetical protein